MSAQRGTFPLLIADVKLRQHVPKGFAVHWVRAGESLKDLNHFPSHFSKLHRLLRGHAKNRVTIVSLGGGSVSDFAGTFAALYQRGVELIHVPSTWLAAMDSVHGGKTALNLGKFKNQLGTFYPARQVVLDRALLLHQPEKRAREAYGEVLKTALISGGSLHRFVKSRSQLSAFELWKLLPQLVAAKNAIVQRDPYEQKGLRQILNLGHTVGHVFEGQLGLAHGTAVLYGLMFDVFSFGPRNLLKDPCFSLQNWRDLQKCLRQIPQPIRALKTDKKRISSDRVAYPLVLAPGRVSTKSKSFEEIAWAWKKLSNWNFQNLN